ncbi:AAA family ATPase [Peribacillus loiseleuriae]|uniref:AAA family ATPase n=1 Tax=Peribacillus loiseleuriae TaxID=1679170 RepID=UPI001FDFADDC|nr:AAA family ATPase [Peribacillus loiseleuriae]
MRQRLLFGQSILAKPNVLLLDEPTNGLDPYWVNQFVEIFNQIKKKWYNQRFFYSYYGCSS